MSRYPLESLRNKLSIKHGFPFKSEFFSDSGKYIVLTPGNFFEEGGFKRQIGKEKFYTGEVPEEYLHNKGDLVVAMTEQAAGLLGSCAFVPENDTYLHNQRLGHITVNNQSICDGFVYYLFMTNNVRNQIRQSSSGSKIKHTSPERIYDVVAPIPKKEEQVKIAKILSNLDKKIELNNKINTELEAMAKLIYNYWFVQFDFPDVNGKPYKSSGGKMVYNEVLKREIPDGWGNTTLGDICDLYQPQTISEKEMTADGKYLVYGANGVVGKYNHFNHEKCVVTITCRGNSCGTINTTRPFSWVTGNAMVVNPKYDYLSIDYLVSTLYWANVSTVITGSAQPQITRTNLAPLKLVSPDSNLVKKYLGIVEVNHLKRVKVQEVNEQLKELRDWILPMLMNGQLTVKN